MATQEKIEPVVSVIVVTYESADYIEACLRSIEADASIACETIVVDNASTDDTTQVIGGRFPGVTLIPLGETLWYTAAANLGAARARGRHILFLNPDAELTAGALPALVHHLDDHPRVAAAGPRLRFPDGTPQDAAFTYPSLLMTWLEFFPHPGRFLHSRINGRLSTRDDQPLSIDHPLGACMLVRRAAWQEVEPFDEGFVQYCEEVDWCMRARRRGWTISLVPTAVVIHHGGASTAAAPGPSLERLYASRERLHAKHRGPLFRIAARFITRLGLGQERRRWRRRLRSGDGNDGAAERIAAIERTLDRARA